MKLRHLHEALQGVSAFPAPDYELEQYKTSAELAAHVLFTLHNRFDAFDGRHVADLGTGTGILALGAALLGACHVVGVDVDPAALAAAAGNAAALGLDGAVSLLQCDVLRGGGGPPLARHGARPGVFDSVVMNPPFGTRRPGADTAFLRAGLALVAPGGAVYSLHKSSTRAHIVRAALAGSLAPDGAPTGVELVAQLRFDIPATYDFHRADSLDVDVDLVRLVRAPSREAADLLAKADALPAYVPASPHAVAAASAATARDAAGARGRRAPGR